MLVNRDRERVKRKGLDCKEPTVCTNSFEGERVEGAEQVRRDCSKDFMLVNSCWKREKDTVEEGRGINLSVKNYST